MKASHSLKALRRATVGLVACWAVALMAFAVRLPAETPLKSPDRLFKPLRLDKTATLTIPAGVTYIPLQLRKDESLYSLTVSATDASLLPDMAQVTVAIVADGKPIAQKSLHLADPDWYCVFRADPKKGAMLVVDSKVATSFRLTLLPLKVSGDSGVVLEAEPNDDWRHAQPVPLGATVIGTADDRPYFIAPDMDEGKALQTGVDWFKVEQPDEAPKLVHFNLDILDRDVPANITVYTLNEKGELVPYTEGYDPVSGPHEAQVGPPVRVNGVELNSANKFTTRVLRKGTYFVKVEANDPAYRLRMTVYEPPPYLREEK